MNQRKPEDIFFDALELGAEARETFILEACAGDGSLLAEVRSLLTSHAKAGGFLEAPAIGAAADAVRDTADPNVGRQVGAFRVVRRIAAGGMGQVYLAERTEGEFTQEVAIKLIRRHLQDDDALRRFRNECQVLAMLEHPNIARMIDGGFTGDGTPFIVMEFVDGVPIDTYCAENDLEINQRLDLFRTVCEAVQHAHRHSTIHRDIKPANILVDRSGTVKLVDFGIARVMDAAEGVSIPRQSRGL